MKCCSKKEAECFSRRIRIEAIQKKGPKWVAAEIWPMMCEGESGRREEQNERSEKCRLIDRKGVEV
jgi:hypothetical protein